MLAEELVPSLTVHLRRDFILGFATGKGGATSHAAILARSAGIPAVIADGRAAGTLKRVLDPDVDEGTLILPSADPVARRKHWIAYELKPAGELILDAGAVRALVEQGKSLLPSGIVGVEGRFRVGAPVHCRCPDGRVVAAGLINYSSSDIEKIKGRKSSEIEDILGFRDSDEVVHRDNLVLLDADS